MASAVIIIDTPQEIVIMDNKITEIETYQDEHILTNGKYKYIPETVINEDLKYRVDEYIIWKGKGNEPDKGYVTYFFKSNGSKKAIATGVKQEEWSYDWTDPIEKSVFETSTTTIK